MNASEFPLAVLLQHVSKLFDDRIRACLAQLGLHPAQGIVLRSLTHRDGVSQRELTYRMRIAAPTITGILSRLEESKLIRRRPDKNDERVSRVYLTASGRHMGRAACAAMDRVERVLVGNLSLGQLRKSHEVLRLLRKSLGGEAPPEEPPVQLITLDAQYSPRTRRR